MVLQDSCNLEVLECSVQRPLVRDWTLLILIIKKKLNFKNIPYKVCIHDFKIE